MSDNMTLTAYNEATEPDRIDRLSRVGKALQKKRRIRLTGSIMSKPTPIIETSIRALHDHKGVLFVDWAEQPTTQDMAAVSRVEAANAEWRRITTAVFDRVMAEAGFPQ
jgi:hypothetical protein